MTERQMRAAFYSEMLNATEELYWKMCKEGFNHKAIQKAFNESCANLSLTDIEPPPDTKPQN